MTRCQTAACKARGGATKIQPSKHLLVREVGPRSYTPTVVQETQDEAEKTQGEAGDEAEATEAGDGAETTEAGDEAEATERG